MIYRNFLGFNEKIYDTENWYDLPRKVMIYREVCSEKIYDLPRIGIIYRKNLLFTEKSYDLPRKSMIYREIQLFSKIFYALLNYDFYSF